ncbi:MAG: hypothetical protein BWY14_00609 [Parcubacteria group bacterium ADurb.Bin192]|nr:MAG: hypothetical protein BWY14_00609 [Parcubacteria group bacterium ADurb.Bin192]
MVSISRAVVWLDGSMPEESLKRDWVQPKDLTLEFMAVIKPV